MANQGMVSRARAILTRSSRDLIPPTSSFITRAYPRLQRCLVERHDPLGSLGSDELERAEARADERGGLQS